MFNVARPRAAGQSGIHKPARPAHGICRLTLTIGTTTYKVRPLQPDRAVALQAFRLRKPDGMVYHVVRHDHGAECDCPDFIFHRDGIDPDGCKHVKALTACGLLIP